MNLRSKANSEYITLKSGVTVEKVGDLYYYQEDIILSNEQLKLLDETGSMFYDPKELGDINPLDGIPVDPRSGMTIYYEPSKTKSVGRNPSQNMFWSMLRFAYSDTLTLGQKYVIKDAMDYMESITNVRFFDATYEPIYDPNYGFEYPLVVFTSSNENSSSVGRIGGKQILRISNFSRGIITHEICHALGMFHEQCRADRDDYVNINFSNIKVDEQHNFRKETSNYYMIGSFDFNSIMLYGSYDFAINFSIPTMSRKDGSTFYANRSYLSENDRKFINTFYLPYIARPDVCSQLDDVVYDSNNQPLTEAQRIDLERQLNVNRCSYPIVPVYTDAVVTMKTAKSSVSFYIAVNQPGTIDWGDGKKETITASTDRKLVSHSYGTTTSKTINILGKNTAVTYLSLDGNGITDFDASKCSELTYLSVTTNNLSKIDLANHPKLLNFGAANNSNIKSIDFSKTPLLKAISVESTGITSLNVSYCKSLTYLAFSHTGISNINLTSNTLLESIIFHGSSISTLDISKNKALRKITCRSTPLISNSSNFSNFAAALPSRVSNPISGTIDYLGSSATSTLLKNKNWIFGN